MENQRELEAAQSALKAWFKSQGITDNSAIVLMASTIGMMLLDSKDPERGFRAVRELFDAIVRRFPGRNWGDGHKTKPAP